MNKQKPIYKRPKFWTILAGAGLAGGYALNGDWQAAVSALISAIVGP